MSIDIILILLCIHYIELIQKVKCCHLSRHPWLLADGRLVTARLEGPRIDENWDLKIWRWRNPRISIHFSMARWESGLEACCDEGPERDWWVGPSALLRGPCQAFKPTVSRLMRTILYAQMVMVGPHWVSLTFQWVSCLVSSHSVFSEAAEGKGRSRGAAWSRFRSTSAEKLLVALQNAKHKLLQLRRPGWGCWTKRIQRQQRCRVADFSQGLQSIECN